MASVNRYRLLRRIATGGMAEVFEALAVGEGGFERRVAIKQVLPHLASEPSILRMFFDEARLAASLHQANIVSVLDYGTLDGRPFQVLELIDGETAAELARRKPMPVEVALHICREVARALHHAHGATDGTGRPLGIVHRDVNPANILVAWSGDVKLVDFGIAFALDRREQTAAGAAKGTLAFMAPEQLMGRDAADIDARADVFALGCTLHALISGASPIASSGGLGRLLDGRPVALSEQIPADVEPIIARATAPATDARYPDARQLGDAIGSALSARSAVDGRDQLESWLADLSRAPARGRLDHLLLAGAELVRVDTDPGDAVRRFETRIVTAPRPPRRRWPALVAATAALGAILIAVIAFGQSRTESEPVSEPEPEPEPEPAPAPAPAPASAPASAPAPAPAPTPARRPDRSRARGVITVGGARAVGAELFIDGKRVGYAPKRVELPVGAHTLLLVRPDGQKLRRRIEVTARDTGLRPRRVRID